MKIDRHQYPELDLILWDRAERHITGIVALRCYEERWAFIDETRLTPTELALIDKLKEQYGHGYLLTA